MQNNLSANQIRQQFLSYFQQHQHKILPGSSLIPHNDPTLLFTNAGMVQFKSIFLGTEKAPAPRATTSQPCVRAGGKHNDLENVGYTARHHTFFEMLGNFSFGDYFKRDAIRFAWQFLTEQLKLPAEKLWITVFRDDQEAADIWIKEIGVDPTRFSFCEESSNFWAMGPTGPCGPCTEIFYDHGPSIAGGPPGSPDEDGDRYIEIWNLVFMQYNRDEDGTLTPLPKPSVDTGMGLERITAIMQGVHNNYDTDLFQPLIQFTAKLANITDYQNTSLRVIADHIRSAVFLITDGVIPANEGRGYVLRRIIRRALRHGAKLNLHEPFFYRLVQPLVSMMQAAYPALQKSAENTIAILQREEEQFRLTLSQGIKLFEQTIQTLTDTIIPGETVFKLYDTYGFPVDLTADMARERQLTIDHAGFEKAMQQQRTRSREASQFTQSFLPETETIQPTTFMGYEKLSIKNSKIIAIYQKDKPITQITADKNNEVIIVLDHTPFYAEAGGQVGDQGFLKTADAIFSVTDTQKQGNTYLHIGKLIHGKLTINDTVVAEVNLERRNATVLNHTATHLLHHVLRSILGEHVLQKGSLVTPEKLRFDFSHSAPLTLEEMETIERAVNQAIRANYPATVHETTPENAIAEGAMALFGEKYGETVRVVKFGDSVELCGGTHAHHTGAIGLFKLTTESGVAAGIRRIEAVTGEGALDWIKQQEKNSLQKQQQSEEKCRQLEKEIQQLKEKLASNLSQALLIQKKEMHGITFLATKVDAMDNRALRHAVDQLKNRLGEAIIFLASVNDNRINFVAGVTSNLQKQFPAGELIKYIAAQVDGKGGGRADLAEGGGNQPEHLTKALDAVTTWINMKKMN